MNFIKLTLKYLKSSFVMLAVAAAIPAVLLGVFARPFTSITFLPEYYTSASGRFSDIFWMLIEPQSIKLVFPYILIIPAILIACAYGMGVIERHFKTGKLLGASPLRTVNNSVLSILKTVLILFLLILVLLLLQSGVVALIRRISQGPFNPNNPILPPKILDCIYTTAFSLIVYFIIVVLSLIIGVWAITMQIYGHSFSDAFVETMRTVSKQWFGLIVGLFLPITILSLPQFALNIMRNNAFYFDFLQITVSVVSHLCIFMYYFAYITVSVYHLNGLERRDNKKRFPFGIPTSINPRSINQHKNGR